jgi:LPS O-antigen subunit length determinant protein (WzzB/FepE family)
MADLSFKGRREDSIHQFRAEADPEKISHPQRAQEDHVVDLGPYAHVIWGSRGIIASMVLAAMVLTALATSLLLHKSYRAIAILRPIPKAATASRIAGIFGIGGVGMNPLAGLMGGAGGPGSDEAQEYMTILQSFAFNTTLIERHHLDARLFHSTSLPFLSIFEYNDPRWRAYKRMQKLFSCEYSIKTGNVTLYFKGRTPADAESILGYYVDDLREKLRYREVQSAKAAIDSMKAEARVTSDALLQSQLYELIAKQTQQLKLAQVEADFAFSVLEPPAAPDKPYSPFVILDSILAGLFAFIVVSAFVMIRRIIFESKAT